ncbi:MAG TPA: HWE histidine kinase domain-containing protein [Caulobacteraceae bacterium]|nr:HWE histidine kinase domain-containing protein [Caulobacteraceae bacterium]
MAVRLGEAFCSAAALDGLLVCDAEWKIAFCNNAAGRLLGAVPLESGPRDLWSQQPALGGTTTELQLRSAMLGRTSAEFVAPRIGGEDEWVEVRAQPLDGLTAFFLRDVTGQERTERHLRETNASLRLAHKAAKAATWEWRAGRALKWIDMGAARQLIGLPVAWNADVPVENWRSLVPEEGIKAIERGVAELVAQGEARFEIEVHGADAQDHWLESSGYISERSASGRPLRVNGITVDVTERKLTEQALRHEIEERQRAQAQQRLLIHELNHRVKNTLATVQSIASQSLRNAANREGLELLTARLQALGSAHDLLTRENWEGASLGEIVRVTLAAHGGDGQPRFDIAGPEVRLTPQMALALAMALHELATNATKYGALSNAKGRIRIRWGVTAAADGDELSLTWRERGGPSVQPPRRRGFGSRLIERGLSASLGGRARLSFEPTGLNCEIVATLAANQTASK